MTRSLYSFNSVRLQMWNYTDYNKELFFSISLCGVYFLSVKTFGLTTQAWDVLA